MAARARPDPSHGTKVVGVETLGCPHTAIRDDVSMNLEAVTHMKRKLAYLDLIFVECGGDNLAASFSPELVDASAYVLSPRDLGPLAESLPPTQNALASASAASPNLCAVRILTRDAHIQYRLRNDTRSLTREHLDLYAPARTIL